MADGTWVLDFKSFEVGFSPMAAVDSLTERGNAGSASVMTDVDILDGLLVQGPGLAALTNGTEAGVMSELINYILDVPTADNVTYALGATKLFKLSASTVNSGGSPSWPQAISGCTDGESLARLGAYLYGFYNTATAGDIFRMALGNETIDATWGSTTPVSSLSASVSPSPSLSPSVSPSASPSAAGASVSPSVSPSPSKSASLSPSVSPSAGTGYLEKALHPVATKEDIMIFGNGRYVGVYFGDNDTLQTQKLDFGQGHEVADVAFSNNYWYVAVNGGLTGTNRNIGQLFVYDGAAIETVLADETGVGLQRIGFIHVLDGTVYVAYQDLSSTGDTTSVM